MADPISPILRALIMGRGTKALPKPNWYPGIKAYHGSPYDFEKFDAGQIGAGQGAQSFGHGLYFAENPNTARHYREMLTDLKPRALEGNPNLTLPSWVAKTVASKNPLAFEEMLTNFRGRLSEDNAELKTSSQPWMVEDRIRNIQGVLDALIAHQKGTPLAPPGRMYEVNIRARPEQFLDWDRPLGKMGPDVRNNLDRVWGLPSKPAQQTMPGSDVYKVLAAREGGDRMLGSGDKQWGPVRYTNEEGATRFLRDAGIPGIKYLDQGSRNNTTWVAKHPRGGTWESPNEQEIKSFVSKNPEYTLQPPNQTSNYVVFDPSIVDIMKKYGIAVPGAMGAYNAIRPENTESPFEMRQ